jgi:hypothetical protein
VREKVRRRGMRGNMHGVEGIEGTGEEQRDARE